MAAELHLHLRDVFFVRGSILTVEHPEIVYWNGNKHSHERMFVQWKDAWCKISVALFTDMAVIYCPSMNELRWSYN